jgi:sugar lactone lactonase YvrE
VIYPRVREMISRIGLLGIIVGAVMQGRTEANILFGTEFGGKQIVRIDTVSNSVTTVATTPGNPDSLIFNGQNIIYTDEGPSHALREIDLVTHTDTILSSQFAIPADLTLTPDGRSVLVSDFAGAIIRYDLQSRTSTVFSSPGGNPEGLVFDSTGRLFANLGNRSGGPAGTFVAQLDPLTGAILRMSPGLDSLDGLTMDTTSGLLYGTSRQSGAVYSINPNNLSIVNTILPAGTLTTPDGITSDGAGNLFIAVQGNSRIYQYNIASRSLTPETVVPGTLDDLAPASGLGSPVPEPSSAVLLGIGVAAGLGASIRLGGRRSAA